jgi:hypothetical protein
VYHHTAQVFLERQDIYADDSKEITPFKYSPFFAFLTSPLGFLPIKAAAGVFFVLNFVCTVALFLLALSISGTPPGRRRVWACVLAALLVLRFIFLVWDSGQVPVMICVLVLAALYFLDRNEQAAAGSLLAASILFKYLPAVFIPYFIFRRKYRAAAFSVLFTGLWLLLPALYAGFERNTGWLSTWLPSIIRTSLDHGSYFDFKNQSLISMVLRLLSPSPYHTNLFSFDFRTALLAAYGVCACLYLCALAPVKGRDTRRLDYALLFTFLPLFNPNGWMTNFVSLAFPCVLLITHLQQVRMKDVFVLVCLALSFVFTTFASQDIAGNSLQNILEASSTVTIGALFLVAALVKLKFSPAQEETL